MSNRQTHAHSRITNVAILYPFAISRGHYKGILMKTKLTRAVTGDSEARLIKYWTQQGGQNYERNINYV
jgi:hypothetical protein